MTITTSTTDIWKDCSPQEAASYPYKKPSFLPYTHLDGRYRSLPWLLASLSHFGELCCQDKSIITNQDKNKKLQSLPIVSLISLCKDSSTPDDFNVLFKKDIINGSIVAINADLLPTSTSTSKELNKILDENEGNDQIIFYQHFAGDHWVILLVTFGTIVNVDGYFFNDVIPSELDSVVIRLRDFISRQSSPTTTVTWRRRLHVPKTFFGNTTIFAYTFISMLQRRHRYLEISPEGLSHYKFLPPSMSLFLQCHDRWLGRLDIEQMNKTVLPFVTDEYKDKDNLSVLYQLGWTVQDVEGDGNCGFYVLLMGLLNVGIFDFDVNKENWKGKLFQFRHSLRAHSKEMLNIMYPRGTRDHEEFMWRITQALDDAEIEGDGRCLGLSEMLAPSTFRVPDDYYKPRYFCTPQYHMNPGWAPHVLASKYKIRVIVYFMVVDDNDCTWSIVSFEYVNERHLSKESPHVNVIQVTDLTTASDLGKNRISDIEFKRIPTIEILYQTGHKPGSTHHFQYLQRTICSGVPKPPELSRITLKEFVARQEKNPSLSGLVDKAHTEDESKMDIDPPIDNAVQQELEGTTLGTLDSCPPRASQGASTSTNPEDEPTTGLSTRTTSKRVDKIPVKTVTGSTLKKPPKKSNQLTRSELSLQRVILTGHFDLLVNQGQITPVRLKYDSKTSTYYAMSNVGNKKTRHVVDPSTLGSYNQLLVQSARKHANIWVGPTVGSARIDCVGTGDAPVELCTEKLPVAPYQQLNEPFCLCYAMANALFYAEYKEQADLMYSAAPRISKHHFDNQIGEFLSLMQNVLPVIASPTVYNQRLTSGIRKTRSLSWDTLFNERSPYPTLVIPERSNGQHDHAFCVIDDLIFDSTTPRALKLCMDSVRWLYQGEEPRIFRAYRFETKYSPPGTPKKFKTKGRYKHEPKENW